MYHLMDRLIDASDEDKPRALFLTKASTSYAQHRLTSMDEQKEREKEKKIDTLKVPSLNMSASSLMSPRSFTDARPHRDTTSSECTKG